MSAGMRVVVTGGAGGIGAAVCQQLNSGGHTAIVVDRVEPAGSNLPFIAADATCRGEIRAAIHAAKREYGEIDGLVNSIGVYAAVDLGGFTWPAFDHSVLVNVAAPIEATLALAEVKAAGSRATVVNLGSAGARTPSRDLAYAATKAALEGATRSLAQSLAQDGVLVFCVAPGLVDTPMSRRMDPLRRNAHAERSWLKRPCEPDEIASLVCYLLTGPSAFLTGTVINASGGLLPS